MKEIPIETEELENLNTSCFVLARLLLTQNLLGEDTLRYFEEIEKQINQNYEIYKNKNTKASVEYCNNILRKIFTQIIEEPLQSKKI